MALRHHLGQLSEDLRQHSDILEHLRTAPEHEAIAIIRRLRSTRDVSTVLSRIKNDVPPVRPSSLTVARAILPPVNTQVEFELTMLHKMVYPSLAPLDIASIDLSNLSKHTSLPTPQSATSPTHSADPAAPMESAVAKAIDPVLLVSGRPLLRGVPVTRVALTQGPLQPPKYCDARLTKLRIRFWTKVPISDELAATVISSYLENYHAVYGWFDTDMFLEDLINHRLEYCSTFLATAFLGAACVSTSAYVFVPNSLRTAA